MNNEEYYEMIKLRTMFVICVAICVSDGGKNTNLETADIVIPKLYILANEKLRENCNKYLPLFKKIIPHVEENNATYLYENEKTLNDVLKYTGVIDGIEAFKNLKEELDNKDLHDIVELALLYYHTFYPKKDDYGLTL